MADYESDDRNEYIDEPVVYPTIKHEIHLVLWFMLISGILGAALLPIPGWLHMKPDKSINALLLLLAYAGGLLMVVRMGYKKYYKNTGNKLSFKFSKVPIIVVLVSLAMILTMPVLTDPISVLIPMSDYWKKYFADMGDTNIFSIVTVIVAAPILEEFFFRGVILNGLLKNYSPQKAIIVSAAIFGIAHFNPWQAIPAFLGGLIMGWMYWKTNSIIPGMILHFVNNLFSTLLGMAFKDADTIKELVSTPVYIILYLACSAILMGGWVFLEKYFEDNPTPEDDEFEPELVTLGNKE
jgi:membrane protease YdiL (CAAX protease family)